MGFAACFLGTYNGTPYSHYRLPPAPFVVFRGWAGRGVFRRVGRARPGSHSAESPERCSVPALRVALVARLAHPGIARDARVVIGHGALGVRVAVGTGELDVGAGVEVTLVAGHVVVAAGDGECVVEGRALPGGCVVARGTDCRESRGGVVRIGCGLVEGQVASGAGCGQTGVHTVGVALGARPPCVAGGERERGRVVERGAGPGGGGMAL